MFPFLLYTAMSLLSAFFRELINSDELWNYSFGANISHGLLPYRDFNYLQTPLSGAVNGLLFSIFGDHILIMRLAGAVLFTAIAMQLFRICRKLGLPRLLASIPGSVFILVFSGNIFFEYSGLTLFLLLTVMNRDLGATVSENKPAPGGLTTCLRDGWLRPSHQLITGMLCGLAILSKQTYGVFLTLAGYVCALLICRMHRLDGGRTLKTLFCRLLGSAVPPFIFLIYLLYTRTFPDFWDMCFKGISTFSSRYRYTSMMKENPGCFIAGLALPMILLLGACYIFLVFYRLKQRKEWEDELSAVFSRGSGLSMLIILIYSIFGFINMYPLANIFHFETCAIPLLPAAGLLLEKLSAFLRIKKHRAYTIFRKFLKAAALLGTCAIMVFLCIYNPVYVLRNYSLKRDMRDFEYTFMRDETSEEIGEVMDFILQEKRKGNEVFVVDNRAAFYFSPLNIYHKYLDMFLKGNLGTTTPKECLMASLKDNSVYLFPGEDRENTQYPQTEVKEFKRLLKPDGAVSSLLVYRVH